MVTADVRINPPDFVSDDPNWVSMLAWQGGLANQRGLVIDNLEKVGPGHYRTTGPVPVWGVWKTLLRVHDGKTLTAVPIYLHGRSGHRRRRGPCAEHDDAALRPRDHHPAARAQPRHARRRCGPVGCLVVLGCTLILIAGLTWGAGRLNRTETSGSKPEFQPTAQA